MQLVKRLQSATMQRLDFTLVCHDRLYADIYFYHLLSLLHMLTLLSEMKFYLWQ